jgi:hypothetical protein
MADWICNTCGNFMPTVEGKCTRCGSIHCNRCISANGGKCPDCGNRMFTPSSESLIKGARTDTKTSTYSSPGILPTATLENRKYTNYSEADDTTKLKRYFRGLGKYVVILVVLIGLFLAGVHFLPALGSENIGLTILKVLGLLPLIWLGLAIGGVLNAFFTVPIILWANVSRSKNNLINGLRYYGFIYILGLLISGVWVYYSHFIWSMNIWNTVYIGVALITFFWGARNGAMDAIKHVGPRKMEWEE